MSRTKNQSTNINKLSQNPNRLFNSTWKTQTCSIKRNFTNKTQSQVIWKWILYKLTLTDDVKKCDTSPDILKIIRNDKWSGEWVTTYSIFIDGSCLPVVVL